MSSDVHFALAFAFRRKKCKKRASILVGSVKRKKRLKFINKRRLKKEERTCAI